MKVTVQLKSAINGLAITMEKYHDQMKQSNIVINDPEFATTMFGNMSKEAGKAGAREVLKEFLEVQQQQQQQIGELTNGVVALTNLVQSMLESNLTVTHTHEEVVTKKVTQTQTVSAQQKEREQTFDEGKFWVHVPTTPAGRIRWKGNDEMTTEDVIYQVIYELETVRGENVDRFKDVNKSIYNHIKNRMTGIPWSMIVEEARRHAKKL